MSISQSSAVFGRGAALANVAPALGQSGICLERPAIAPSNQCFTWSCWEQMPHPILGSAAHHQTTRGTCCFINDAPRSFDGFRYVAVAIRAYFYRCATHDGTKWILPTDFKVLRYVYGWASSVPAEMPYKNCCWDFANSFWDVVSDGAPADETVNRAAWPQAIFDGMGTVQSMTLADSCGASLTTWPKGGGLIYSRDGTIRTLGGTEIAGRDCVLDLILPRGVAHDLVIVAEIWKKVGRNVVKSPPASSAVYPCTIPTATTESGRVQANVSLTCYAALSLPIGGT